MRDFDQIEVSSGRRLRAVAVAGIATIALVAAGIGYLHPRLPVPPKPAAEKKVRVGVIDETAAGVDVGQLQYAYGSLWFTYRKGSLTEIWRSSDGGASWSHIYEGGSLAGPPQVLDGQSVLVTIDAEAIRLTAQMGDPLPKPAATNLAIYYAFAEHDHGLALLTDGSLYETVDGGPWHPVASNGVPAAGIKHDLGVTAGGRAWFLDATDSGEFLYLSEDWGRNWRELTPPGLGSFPHLNLAALGEQVIAWYPSRAFRLKGRNATWVELSPPPASGALAIRPDGELLLAVGRDVYRLAGSAWTLLPAPAPEPLRAVAAGDRDQVYAAGESGTLYSLIEETNQWLRLPGPFHDQWMAVPNSP